MTLSILWRSEGRLHLASDSRMSFGQNGSVDVGVKVMRLPIRVVGTDLDQAGNINILFERTYGFCYAGSIVNAATFKHLIEDLLVDVQYVRTDVPLSFGELCRYLCQYSEMVSTEIVSRLVEMGGYTFFVAGLCPSTNRLRGARFKLSQVDGHTVAVFEEVAQDEGEYVAVGKGAPEFDRLSAGQPANLRSVLLALNRVIDERTIDSVGGDIQYGTFKKDGNFAVSGINRISTEETDDSGIHFGPCVQRVLRYRGFELYADWQISDGRFWPSPGFIELDVPSNDESNWRFVRQSRMTIASNAR